MPKPSPKLEWCIVRLGDDHNWWVSEISDSVHWDVDGLSIIDPRQVAHILDLLDPLREYGFQADIFEAAFVPFGIRETLADNRVKLVRAHESLLESEEKLFALPDQVDEEKGPYADFLDHVTKLRVKFLNDAIDFEKHLTVDDLEEEIREDHHNAFLEGRALHAFQEITDILEYVPKGYEVDEDVDAAKEETEKGNTEEAAAEDFPEIDEENIEEDETMKWEEDEEEKKEGEGEGEGGEQTEDLDALDDEDDMDLDEDDDEGDEDEGERKEKRAKAPAKPPAKSAAKPAPKKSGKKK
ncbi:MAG TPA: hypothetical protein VHC95_03595 [Opitutales bacterium]|nr:hypothetical protein [Opitutales bacterium]